MNKQSIGKALAFLALATMLATTIVLAADLPQFTSAIDDGPLPVTTLPGETITPEVQKFYDTGEDPYKGDAAALAEGKLSTRQIARPATCLMAAARSGRA